MDDCVPLSALLSQVLVAFIIEFDNEFEHQTPHRTTNHGSTASRAVPWLVSMAMWTRFMQFVRDDAITVREFARAASLTNREIKIWLTRLSDWWGYVTVDKGAHKTPADWIIRPTHGGQKALEVWRPLTGIVETRWLERFGKDAVDELWRLLQYVTDQLDLAFPGSLPILGYDLFSRCPEPKLRAATKPAVVPPVERTLPALLAKVLLAFAIRYEQGSGLSLAVSANLLRLGGDEEIPIRDLPPLSGVSKEGTAMLVKRATDSGLAVIPEEAAAKRLKVLRFTTKGQQARKTYYRIAQDIESDWKATFGSVVLRLRQLLEYLVGQGRPGESSLFRGLEPYPDNWRAAVPARDVLPHYPMILHRGGFPDGS